MAECSSSPSRFDDDGFMLATCENGVDSGPVQMDEDKDKDATVISSPRLTVSTPLLVEDIRDDLVPTSVSRLLEHLRSAEVSTRLSKFDIVVVFMYIIMLEEGFIPADCVDELQAASISYNRAQVLQLSTRLPATWRRTAHVYDVSFVLAKFKRNVCRLVCTTSVDDLVVNCRVQGVHAANYSMLVDPSMYVVESQVSLRVRFQHVKQFAMKFKNLIGMPAKIDVMHVNNVSAPTLEDLPPELKCYLEKMVRQHFFDKL